MIQGMNKKGRKEWTVYILRCGDGSLYTGIASKHLGPPKTDPMIFSIQIPGLQGKN
jgi:hypothetical protein